MSIITDEMVEKAARAMFKECRGDCYPFEKVSDNRKPYWRAASRAALSAVIADVVEECAKVADWKAENLRVYAKVATRDCVPEYADGALKMAEAAVDIAACIRALKDAPHA